MLTNHPPADVLVEWAAKIAVVQNAKDRPWYYAQNPKVACESYNSECNRCSCPITMKRHPCEGNSAYVYMGQCSRCEKILWSVLECAGK